MKNVLLVLDDNIFRNYDEGFLSGPVYIHHNSSTGKSKWNNIQNGFGYFLDNSHFTTEVGNKILDKIYKN